MAEDKKHFDVAHPGTTTPQHTSRPIIVSRSNVVDDPMVKQNTEQPVGESQDKKSTLSHASLGLTTPAVKDTSKDTDTKTTAEDNTVDTKLQDSEVSGESITSNTTTSTQASIVPDKVEELIQSKAYELPISRPKSKAVMLFAFVLLMIVLVGVVVYIAMLATGRL